MTVTFSAAVPATIAPLIAATLSISVINAPAAFANPFAYALQLLGNDSQSEALVANARAFERGVEADDPDIGFQRLHGPQVTASCRSPVRPLP